MRYFCDAREVFGRQRAQEGFRTSVFLKKLQKIEMICVSQFAHVCLCTHACFIREPEGIGAIVLSQ